MQNHTPGPWRAVLDNDSRDPISIFQDDGTGNGDHIMAIAGDPESEANMRLIAAAPDLLSALKLVARGLNSRHITARPIMDTSDPKATEWPILNVSEIVLAAIAKATT